MVMGKYILNIPTEVVERLERVSKVLGEPFDLEHHLVRALAQFEFNLMVDYRERECGECHHFTASPTVAVAGMNASDPNMGTCRGMPHNVFPAPGPKGQVMAMHMERVLPRKTSACACFKLRLPEGPDHG